MRKKIYDIIIHALKNTEGLGGDELKECINAMEKIEIIND